MMTNYLESVRKLCLDASPSFRNFHNEMMQKFFILVVVKW